MTENQLTNSSVDTPAQKAENYQEISKQLLSQLNATENELIETKAETERALQELSSENENLKMQLIRINKEKFGLENQLHEMETEKIKIQSQFQKEMDVLTEKVKKLKEKKNLIKKSVKDFQNEINFNKIQNDSLNETLKVEKNKSCNLEKLNIEFNTIISCLKNSLNLIKKSLDNNTNDQEIQTIIESIESEETKKVVKECIRLIEFRRNEKNEIVKEMNEREKDIIFVANENQQLATLLGQIQVKEEELIKIKDDLTKDNEQLKIENEELNELVKSQKKELRHQREELDELLKKSIEENDTKE